ncbi:hypothetical protein A2716_01540 [candidate division WWE3 bacterium RIFCSPHIGHO2_01_FULL_40_23]|uniref:Uncharacterized protein n=1 Tax=candidate division WWE3 bacterium RIFCSPLOWO2_01_FULL_41_18 TaxID=1802625 RepID=A0A1F4VEU9_UNCKA|nr:MAG: hypothetical protein A2716_01540 [candidate division WWE3 bacterium RIFCSPHIGHO2_01_FULL_40_23]OGC55679.1 MAG: hypothetical protein A3A78_01390 [candidate division WWE3 bacterium RIFCSPLOWO2_01_FULL_41_18]
MGKHHAKGQNELPEAAGVLYMFLFLIALPFTAYCAYKIWQLGLVHPITISLILVDALVIRALVLPLISLGKLKQKLQDNKGERDEN